MNFDRSEADSNSNIRNLHIHGEGGTFLDCGANIGFVSIAAAKQFDSVFAVEAHPETYEMACKNIEVSGLENIELILGAVMNETGKVAFVSTPENSIGASARFKKRLKKEGYYKEVLSISLEELILKYKPRVVKIDIEGSEYDCLDGLEILPCVEAMQIEFHGTRSKQGWERFTNIKNQLLKQQFVMIKPSRISMHKEGYPKSFLIDTVFKRAEK
jgi:FkbM family methyltransferase